MCSKYSILAFTFAIGFVTTAIMPATALEFSLTSGYGGAIYEFNSSGSLTHTRTAGDYSAIAYDALGNLFATSGGSHNPGLWMNPQDSSPGTLASSNSLFSTTGSDLHLAVSPTAIPEPASVAILLIAAFCLFVYGWSNLPKRS